MRHGVGLAVANISPVRNDHETGKPDTDPQTRQLITSHAHAGIFHQHHRLHAAQPRPAAQSYPDSLVGDRDC